MIFKVLLERVANTIKICLKSPYLLFFRCAGTNPMESIMECFAVMAVLASLSAQFAEVLSIHAYVSMKYVSMNKFLTGV